MGDKRLNDLLRWSVENTTTGENGPSTENNAQVPPPTNLTPELMAALMEGPPMPTS